MCELGHLFAEVGAVTIMAHQGLAMQIAQLLAQPLASGLGHVYTFGVTTGSVAVGAFLALKQKREYVDDAREPHKLWPVSGTALPLEGEFRVWQVSCIAGYPAHRAMVARCGLGLVALYLGESTADFRVDRWLCAPVNPVQAAALAQGTLCLQQALDVPQLQVMDRTYVGNVVRAWRVNGLGSVASTSRPQGPDAWAVPGAKVDEEAFSGLKTLRLRETHGCAIKLVRHGATKLFLYRTGTTSPLVSRWVCAPTRTGRLRFSLLNAPGLRERLAGPVHVIDWCERSGTCITAWSVASLEHLPARVLPLALQIAAQA